MACINEKKTSKKSQKITLIYSDRNSKYKIIMYLLRRMELNIEIRILANISARTRIAKAIVRKNIPIPIKVKLQVGRSPINISNNFI